MRTALPLSLFFLGWVVGGLVGGYCASARRAAVLDWDMVAGGGVVVVGVQGWGKVAWGPLFSVRFSFL